MLRVIRRVEQADVSAAAGSSFTKQLRPAQGLGCSTSPAKAFSSLAHCCCDRRDDVADHQQWAKHFNAPRIMHQADVHGELRAIETQLQGSGPWDFSGQALQDSAGSSSSGGPEQERELVIVHTPGHTRGHTCLYYAPSKVLFAGGLACAGCK